MSSLKWSAHSPNPDSIQIHFQKWSICINVDHATMHCVQGLQWASALEHATVQTLSLCSWISQNGEWIRCQKGPSCSTELNFSRLQLSMCKIYVYLLQVQKVYQKPQQISILHQVHPPLVFVELHRFCVEWSCNSMEAGVATWSQLNAYNKWTVNQMAVWSPGSVWVHCNKNLTLYNPKFLLHSCKHIWLLFSMNTFLK